MFSHAGAGNLLIKPPPFPSVAVPQPSPPAGRAPTPAPKAKPAQASTGGSGGDHPARRKLVLKAGSAVRAPAIVRATRLEAGEDFSAADLPSPPSPPEQSAADAEAVRVPPITAS